MEKELLFVYGTLMEGFGNHSLLGDSKKIAEVTTVDKFTMHSVGFPFITKDMPDATWILGELYEVDKGLLESDIDALEGHPNWYCREVIEVFDPETKETHQAWAYLNDDPGGRLVVSGSFREFMGR